MKGEVFFVLFINGILKFGKVFSIRRYLISIFKMNELILDGYVYCFKYLFFGLVKLRE